MSGSVGVAVVGAGMTGLTAALTLVAQGVDDVRVFEAAHSLEEIGAGIAIGGNAVRVLRHLGVDASTFGHVPPALEFRRWRDGRILAVNEVGPRYAAVVGAPYLTFHRATLQRALVERIERAGVAIALGHRLAQIDVGDAQQPATLTFDNGQVVRAQAVIAADGVHSVARKFVAPELRPRYSGEIAFRGVVAADRVPDYPCVESLSIWCGPATHAVNYAVDDGALINLFAVVRPERLPPWTERTNRAPGQRAEAVADFRARGWDRRVVDLVEASEGDLHYWALMDLPPPPRWHRGRVVLAGDSVHAPLPHQGMGGGMGIESGYAIGALIARHGLTRARQAFDEFVALRAARVRRVQIWSRMAGMTYKLTDDERRAQRDRSLWQVADRIRWIHAYDVIDAVRAFAGGGARGPQATDDALARAGDVLQRRFGVVASSVRPTTQLAELGLDSLDALELLLELDPAGDAATIDPHALRTVGDVLAALAPRVH
jgi:salicylate hydroxylase